jgi:hypothetical protein
LYGSPAIYGVVTYPSSTAEGWFYHKYKWLFVIHFSYQLKE